MWQNPQFPANLVRFTKEILMENFTFCAVIFYAAQQIPNILICNGFAGKLYNLKPTGFNPSIYQKSKVQYLNNDLT